MPRDAAGVYTLPTGYLAVTGQTVEASQHNPPLEDIAAALTGSVPRNGSAGMLGPLSMAGNKIVSVGAPTADTDAATKAYIDAAIAALATQIVTLPAGLMGIWPGDTPPPGWIIGDGRIVSRTGVTAGIFAAYGTKYGAGDGSTTFGLPNVCGEFLRFADLGRGIDPGRTNGSWQAQEIQSHAHGVNDPGHAHSYQDRGFWSGAFAYGGTLGSSPSDSDNGRVTSGSGTGISIQATGGSETRPRNIAFIGIIKT